MNLKITRLQSYLYITCGVILLSGLSSAVMIYRAAMNDPNNESGYEVLGGFVYSTDGNSKKYMHDLQLYGGSAAVLADEFMHWFAGLWHGESLAFTVACITIFVSLAIFLVAYKLPVLMQSDDGSENDGEKTE